MRKIILLLTFFLSVFLFADVKSNDNRSLGKKIFNQKACDMCHKKSLASIGPSLEEIAFTYSGRENTLINYLKGNAKAIVKPKKAYMMKGQLIKLKAIDESKIKAIARYIITISDREF